MPQPGVPPRSPPSSVTGSSPCEIKAQILDTSFVLPCHYAFFVQSKFASADPRSIFIDSETNEVELNRSLGGSDIISD